MKTYDEAFAAAIDRPAFSNGTEGECWMDAWCNRCIHDKGTRDGSNPKGCDLVMVALMGRTPTEWLEQDNSGGWKLSDAYHCIEFRNEDDPGPGYEAPPDPPLAGQGELLPAEPYRGIRMFADVVQREVVTR